MFLTSLYACGPHLPSPQIRTSQGKQRPPPDPLVEHPAGAFAYKLFGAVHAFTLPSFAASGGGYSDSPSMPSRANAVKRDTARKYFF